MMMNELLASVGFDHLSWILVALVLLTLFIHGLVNPEASWTIHPILLGHQSTFARIRKQAETPIITNSGSTHALLPVTPDRSIKNLHDLILQSEGKLHKTDISSIIPSNLSLKSLVSDVRNHLWSLLANTRVEQEQSYPQLVILCTDPYVKLVFSLAAATLPIVTVMANTYQSGSLPANVKQVLAPYLANSSLIISEISKDDIQQSIGSSHLSARVISIKDLSSWFQSKENTEFHSVPPTTPSEMSQARLRIVHNFPKSDDSRSIGVGVFEFTPENLLAGITASLGLFPSTGKLTPKDTVALESYGNGSIWGSEISLAVAALYAGADVYFFNSFKHLSECKPTVLVVKAMTAQILSEEIIQLSKLSFFKKLSIARRLSKVSGGSLAKPMPETSEWVGPKLRAILTNDAISQSCANLIRAGFGVSLQRMFTHPIGAGPILASHPYDLQTLQRPNSALHCGPPSVNIECKITNVPEPSLTDHDAWKGNLLVRGPSIGVELNLLDSNGSLLNEGSTNNNSITKLESEEKFFLVAPIAHVLPNGTFHVLSVESSASGDD